MFRLLVKSGAQNRVEVALDASRRFSLGRHKSCDLQLLDRGVSRRHATLVSSGDGHALEDEQSNNGTFVNGVRIQRTKLNPGDRIQIGKTVLAYCGQQPVITAAPSMPAQGNRRKAHYPKSRRRSARLRARLGITASLVITILTGWVLVEAVRVFRISALARRQPVSGSTIQTPRPPRAVKNVNPAATGLSIFEKAKGLVAKASHLYRERRNQPEGSNWSSRALDYLAEAETVLNEMKVSGHGRDAQDKVERRKRLFCEIQVLRNDVIKVTGFFPTETAD